MNNQHENEKPQNEQNSSKNYKYFHQISKMLIISFQLVGIVNCILEIKKLYDKIFNRFSHIFMSHLIEKWGFQRVPSVLQSPALVLQMLLYKLPPFSLLSPAEYVTIKIKLKQRKNQFNSHRIKTKKNNLLLQWLLWWLQVTEVRHHWNRIYIWDNLVYLEIWLGNTKN